MKKLIRAANGPAPRGPYTPGIVTAGRLLFVAGQLPLEPTSGELVPGGIDGQTRQALANLRAVVEAAGARMEDVVRVGVFLADIGDRGRGTELSRSRAVPPAQRDQRGVASLGRKGPPCPGTIRSAKPSTSLRFACSDSGSSA